MVIEAAICDTPVVNICFNGKHNQPRNGHRDINIDRNQIHNKRIERTGGASIAENPLELFKYINNYISDPALHKKERKRIIDNEAGPCRGRAGEVIGSHILDILDTMQG
jgi:hypothetical protein